MTKKFKQIITLTVFSIYSLGGFSMLADRYEGLCKLPGFNDASEWVELTITGNKIHLDLGEGVIEFDGTCKKTGVKTLVINSSSLKSPITLTTNDKGQSYSGSSKLPGGQKMDFWFLKVPEELVESTLSDEQLKEIVTSKDGYTAFLKLNDGNITLALTYDLELDKDGHYKFIGDSPIFNQLINNFREGEFEISDGKITLIKNSDTVSGTIYDNGKYITIPLGKGGTIQLIR